MNEVFQALGSVASILGVPLAVYLYFKSQADKYLEVRRSIVSRLSHQIGEGRAITSFEIQAVIDSLTREKRLKVNSISSDSVVEDIVAEALASPLLEKAKKDELLKELSAIHTSERERASSQRNGKSAESELANIKEKIEEQRNQKLQEEATGMFIAMVIMPLGLVLTAVMNRKNGFGGDLVGDVFDKLPFAPQLSEFIVESSFLVLVLIGGAIALVAYMIIHVYTSATFTTSD